MQITDVQIQLSSSGQDRLRAFCNIIIDDAFVVRDIKIIDGPQGPFVAMPSRKIMVNCPACHSKNHRLASFCNQCGVALPKEAEGGGGGRATTKLHSDIAHPINAACRGMVQQAILDAYHKELENAKKGGYTAGRTDQSPDGASHAPGSTMDTPEAPSTDA